MSLLNSNNDDLKSSTIGDFVVFIVAKASFRAQDAVRHEEKAEDGRETRREDADGEERRAGDDDPPRRLT